MRERSTWKRFHILFDYGKADPNEVNKFEVKHNICLPRSYKGLMLEHNGANFREENFNFINKSGQEDMRTFLFKSFGEKRKGKEHIEDAQLVSKPDYYGVPGLIGIGSTAQGDALCFDYRYDAKTCEPRVVLLVHDEYEEEPDGTIYRKIEPIADNFDAFLDLLYAYRDDEE